MNRDFSTYPLIYQRNTSHFFSLTSARDNPINILRNFVRRLSTGLEYPFRNAASVLSYSGAFLHDFMRSSSRRD